MSPAHLVTRSAARPAPHERWLLSVDDHWRIVFVNLEAERVLGSPEEKLIGQVLWELPAVRQMPGLEDRYRKAAAVSAPTGFEVWTRDAGRCYHLRVVPAPDGTTCYFTDVTEKRKREAERQDAERADAERAARIAEVTAALAEATTARDVVAAVPDPAHPQTRPGDHRRPGGGIRTPPHSARPRRPRPAHAS